MKAGGWIWLRGAIIVTLLVVATISSGPRPVTPWLIAALAAAAIGWIPGVQRPGDQRWELTGLALLGTGGLAILVWPSGIGLVFLVTATLRTARRLRPAVAATAVGALALAFLIVIRATGDPLHLLWPGLGALALSLVVGFARRQNDELRTAADQARAMTARTELAREVHDVLAHSLGALTVQLETADALLEHGRAEQARSSVQRAGRLAREGLAETRRAIGVLRGDSVGPAELLAELADAYEGEAVVTVRGTPRPVDPGPTLVLYRTAQESVTNARKHAPGSTVTLLLAYAESSLELTVSNDGARPAGDLAGTGGGYGLAGLRERAQQAGGRFEAGPIDGGWAVNVTIPG